MGRGSCTHNRKDAASDISTNSNRTSTVRSQPVPVLQQGWHTASARQTKLEDGGQLLVRAKEKRTISHQTDDDGDVLVSRTKQSMSTATSTVATTPATVKKKEG